MAPIQLMHLLLCLLSLQIQARPKDSSFIRPGFSLSPDTKRSSWSSPSGHFAFGFYQQGNGFAVGIWLTSKPTITVVWTANRDDPPVSSNSTIDFTKDGKLLLRSGQGEEKPVVELDDQAVSASMLDSGNFIICGKNSEVIWESFKILTDTILGGQSMSSVADYNQLTSSKSTFDHSSGRFHLELVNAGALAAYPVNHSGRAPEEFYWEILPKVLPLVLALSPSGVLQLSSPNKTLETIASGSSYSVGNETVIYRATLDADGILRLYSHLFEISGNSNVNIEWSALKNQCEVQGFCGFNSYCFNNSSKADCECFPGFAFINPTKRYLGCYRNFNDEKGCQRKEPAAFYNITNMENTKLGGLPYAKLSVNKEDCRKSCLYDCYCGAAFYLNGSCNIFKLPLMFGMKDQNESATVFLKLRSGHDNRSIPRNSPSNQPESAKTESKKKLIRILAASLGSITLLCFLTAISSLILYKLRVNRYKKLPGNPNFDLIREFQLQSFSYDELDKATDGFKEELARGWFGGVYRGTVSNGNEIITVKRLENSLEGRERKFREEMAVVHQTRHRNLVRLLGFCIEGSRTLLVYEYMGKGSLANLIFNVERRPIWKERVRIALDVARGILYLHEECEVPIIHCNITSRSILMDDSWTAKISDFGLAKRLMPHQTGTFAGVRGTRGYMAPELQKNGLLTVKSDVYSFGVVLLEIVCCRSNLEVNVSTADEVLLSTWVYNCFVSRELNKLVEEKDVDMRTLERMVKVGLLCIQDDPSLRPLMQKVILMLEGTMDIPVPPFPTPLVIN